MNRTYRHSRQRGGTSRLFAFLPVVLLIGGGIFGFRAALNWFRASAGEEIATIEAATAIGEVAGVTAVGTTEITLKEVRAPLISAFDSQETGVVDRYNRTKEMDFTVLAYLPVIDTNTAAYEVWLLKDGLADVKDMGELTRRADGSWILSFTAGPATGIADPERYSTLVIMQEPKDGNPAPSGNRIAEANF